MNIPERTEAVVVNQESEVIFHTSQYENKVTVRSTLKPLQVLPVYLLGLDKKYCLNSAELTIMASSHLGQEQHIHALESLLEKTGIQEKDILATPSVPSGHIAYNVWKDNRLPKRKLYHTCAGNHIGMMLAQRELTGKTENYECPDSRIQKEIRQLMATFCEYPLSLTKTTKDGCGVPTYIFPMKYIAILYKNLVHTPGHFPQPAKEAAMNQLNCIWQSPLMLEGDGCLSTIASSYKGLIAKTGAGGLLAFGIKELKYGAVIWSDTGCWRSVSLMMEHILKKTGYHNEKLYKELRMI